MPIKQFLCQKTSPNRKVVIIPTGIRKIKNGIEKKFFLIKIIKKKEIITTVI